MFPMKSIKCTCVGCFPFCEPNPTVRIPDFQNCRPGKRFQLDLPRSGRTFLTHRIHGAGIYANIGGILMGSMPPYIAAPWILWVIAQTLQVFVSIQRFGRSKELWLSIFPLKWGASRSFYELSNHTIASSSCRKCDQPSNEDISMVRVSTWCHRLHQLIGSIKFHCSVRIGTSGLIRLCLCLILINLHSGYDCYIAMV